MNNELFINLLVCVGVVLLAFIGMFYGWRKRSHQAAVTPQFEGSIGVTQQVFERVFYVVTTVPADRRQRAHLQGLRYRGWATLTIAESGVALAVTGEDPVLLAPVIEVSLAGASIAKAVEAGGLLVITWGAGAEIFETQIRFTEPAQQEAALTLLQNIIRGKEAVAC